MSQSSASQLSVVLLGQQNVGKTSLIANYLHGRFSQQTPNSTGASYQFKLVNLDDQQINLQIWDTAGQERFTSFTGLYYRDADGCMIVYDVTEPGSLERAIQIFHNVLRVNRRCKFAFVGNKADLGCKISTNDAREQLQDSLQENIYQAEILQDTVFVETSAKTGANVQDAFEHLVRAALHTDLGRLRVGEEPQRGCCK